MPPTDLSSSITRAIEDVVASVGVYSLDAYYFIQEGLQRAAERAHGPHPAAIAPERNRHISGQQLCEGLREIAIERWGLMAQAVLATWGIHSTLDFGKIVFALIDAGLFQKQPNDVIDDFADVYDFRKSFITDYRIPLEKNVRGKSA
jgi:uncharacterized repeat protein (TIGR04138 family)